MDLKKQILVALGIDKQVSLEYQSKLIDGTIVVSEAEALAEGISISILAEDGSQIPLPVGEYETEDGVGFSVEEEGIVSEIYEDEDETDEEAEVEEEETEEVEAETEEMQPKKIKETKEVEFDKEGLINEIGAVIKELLQEVKTDIERLDAELNEMKGENENLKEANGNLETEKEELKSEVEMLSKEPADKPIKTSKFNEPKKETLSKEEYRNLSRKEKYWYNIKNN